MLIDLFISQPPFFEIVSIPEACIQSLIRTAFDACIQSLIRVASDRLG